jgi:hypothetical protein
VQKRVSGRRGEEGGEGKGVTWVSKGTPGRRAVAAPPAIGRV